MFSHQDPGFIDHVVNKKAEVIRVYLKQPALHYLTIDEAVEHCAASLSIWGSDRGGEPHVVMSCCGGEVLDLLENETGMHSCLASKPKIAGWRRRQEEASPWSREYRRRSGQARSSTSC